MSKFCCGVKAYYIPGVPCMLKDNTLPSAGYANGSQGRMVGIVHEDSTYVLPSSSPGEMIMIPPPQFVIMEVHHKGKEEKTSIFPCEKQETVLEYKRNGKDCCYRCWSNMVVFTFAMTIHETQGQTLERIILLLGRLPGMNVGVITWSLVYVALSRTRKLAHMKFFPTGSTKFYHSMYFAHLLKLSMPANLKKWHRSYVDHCWDRNVLRKEHEKKVRKVEMRLERLGEDKTKRLKWVQLRSFLKQMEYKTTTRDRKMKLFCKLKEHMVKRLLWKTSKDFETTGRKVHRGLKRKANEAEVVSPRQSKSVLRRSKRLRMNAESKEDQEFRKGSMRNASFHKRQSKFLELPLPTPRRADNLRIAKKKQKSKKHGSRCKEMILLPQQSQTQHISVKGLYNLGQTCYFNTIVQSLFHCSLFRNVIENVPEPALSIDVIRELHFLFKRLSSNSPLKHLSPSQCFSSVMNIPECATAHMNKDKQEDAQEFFLMLIEYFHSKFKPLANIFEGNIQSTLSCQHCSHSSIKTDPFRILSLSFPAGNNEQRPYNVRYMHDLSNLLDDFISPEIVSGYDCTHCRDRNSTEKILHILSTPKVLVVQLKRFSGLNKIEDFVKFPLQLRLKYISAGNEEHHFYNITGVVLHKGATISSGHYIAYVLADGVWIEADDSITQEVSWENVSNKNVYLLFYVRL